MSRKKTSTPRHDALAGATVELVRLGPDVTPEAFEAFVRHCLPTMVGSLLGHTHDDWFALAPDVTPALRATGRDERAALMQAGAIGFDTLDADAYEQSALMHHAQAPPASGPRTLDAIGTPTYWRPARYQGREIKLDWHVAAARLPEAWALLGPEGPARYAHLKVAHIDTGYTEHPVFGWGGPVGPWLLPELGVNFWRRRVEPGDLGALPGNWNAAPEHPGPRDNHAGPSGGHGTRTASLLCGLFAPRVPIESPFFGAAPGAAVIPYRITDWVLIDRAQGLLAGAIDDAVAKGVQVISISLGAARRSKQVAAAITAAYRQGVIVCAAAGNMVRPVVYPGRFHCVVTLGGATTSDGIDLHPWRGASRGPAVDVSGPADAIRRATTEAVDGVERYRIAGPGSGTSYATALCAGIAVLWLAHRGTELEAAYGSQRWARAAAFKRLVAETAFTPRGWNRRDYGSGVYQADALLRAELPALSALTQASDL